MTLRAFGLFCALACAHAESRWPEFAEPARFIGGGESDAAVVAGIDGYFAVPAVPGAEANAKAWYDYFTKTRGVPIENVKLLLGADATREEMLEGARNAGERTGPGGTVWFVFIGHGAPSADGKDGLLVGVDAQQKADSLERRGLKKRELLQALTAGRAESIRVILDACFSGRRENGDALVPGLQPLRAVRLAAPDDPRVVVLTAAKSDQFAGALPGAKRPAFSYLVLGGLRGWGAGKKERLTAGDLWRYAKKALEATLQGRRQTPELTGGENAVVARSAGEKGPDLAELAKAAAGAPVENGLFRVSALAAVPAADPPGTMPESSLDLRGVDVAALEEYDAVLDFDKSDAPPEEKAQAWRRFAQNHPSSSVHAGARADEWDRFASQKKAAEEARILRISARDADWEKLSRLLALGSEAVSAADKRRWSAQFSAAYASSPGLEPAMAKALADYLPLIAPKPAL